MSKITFLLLLFFFVFASPAYAFESIKGEATGTFTFQGSFSGTGTLYFVNTGGDAELTTVCDMTTVDTAGGEHCEGLFLKGTFTGGPHGEAVFASDSGSKLTFQLTDGKIFTFSTQGITMELTVTDPSIFDAWTENAETRDSGARVSDLSGQVEIACPPDLEAWDVMKMGRVIYVDCHIKTGEDSKAVISLSDMTTFELKAESEIVIDTPPEKDSKWKLITGNIWVNVKKMIKDGTMEGHMSQAVAGIKGTVFVMTETGSESTIKVIEGVVNFESLATGTGVDVASGESVTATVNGLSEKTTFDTSVEEKSWQTIGVPTGQKSSRDNNLNYKMFYFIGGSVVLLILVIGVVKLKKRKLAN
ncbi:MAG: FecR family protein [Patescibacteria group bacterium]|jgi:hypothetical protein